MIIINNELRILIYVICKFKKIIFSIKVIIGWMVLIILIIVDGVYCRLCSNDKKVKIVLIKMMVLIEVISVGVIFGVLI